VLTFARDPETGLLTQRGCVLQDAPPRGSCASGKGLFGPTALALSADGRTLFAASYDSNAIAVFARNTATGALRWIGCHSEVYEDERDGCGHGAPLTSPTGIAVSRDGSRLYVTVESGLTVLDRDRTTGALSIGGCLTYAAYYDEEITKRCQLASGLAGASGVALSPDGRNVYVTSWDSDAVTVLAPGPTMSALHASRHGLLSVRLTCPAQHDGATPPPRTVDSVQAARRPLRNRPPAPLATGPAGAREAEEVHVDDRGIRRVAEPRAHAAAARPPAPSGAAPAASRPSRLARLPRRERHVRRHGFASESSGQARRVGAYSPGQSAYASSGSSVSFAADAPYLAATSLTG
jgi:hypothetical protein